jgi:Mn2+/Fe2+ NRAMP family transporter
LAATGVGAGDLATAAFTGSQLGTAVLWAVLLGAGLKWVLNEGLARWQLATGETLMEGALGRLGIWVGYVFLPYLLLWSFFVGSALMSACGVTLHAMFPVFEDATRAKIVFGVLSSLGGLGLVKAGGFKLFEKVMSVCIGVMFVVVVVTAVLLAPGFLEVLRGLFVPGIPDAGGSGVTWTVALLGGVGGTLTILCYGYWIREAGRSGGEDLTLCRLDLGLAYGMTAVFGVSMVIIGSATSIEGRGAGLLVALADSLSGTLGVVGRWAFLLGAAGAVFSSLLGVWQAVPYLFADLWRLLRPAAGEETPDFTRTRPYRLFQLGLAIVPMAGLLVSFKEVQKLYAVVGALFIPALALALLVLNSRRAWVGARFANGWAARLALCGALVFFTALGIVKLM